VYPYIRYLSQRRSADTPKDASSAFFYLVKENLDDEWANPQKFADEVCLCDEEGDVLLNEVLGGLADHAEPQTFTGANSGA
jgi:hypothetical protein